MRWKQYSSESRKRKKSNCNLFVFRNAFKLQTPYFLMPRARKTKSQLELFKPVHTLWGVTFEPVKKQRKERIFPVYTENDLASKGIHKEKLHELKLVLSPVSGGEEHLGTNIYVSKKLSPGLIERLENSMKLVNAGLKTGLLRQVPGTYKLVPPISIFPVTLELKTELIKALYDINLLLKVTWSKEMKEKFR